MSAKNFGTTFSSTYPSNLTPSISKVSTAEEVFVGYKLCGNLQKFLLDYAYKLDSQLPLSDEVTLNE